MRISRVSISMGILLPLLAFSFLIHTPQSEAQMPVVRNGDSFASPFALVYEKVAPAVVRIDIEISSRRRNSSSDSDEQSPWEYFFDNPQQQRRSPSRTGMGAGIIVDREGYIVTNNHVIENATTITVRVNEHDEYDAEVVGQDPQTDLAVIRLKLDGELLPGENVAVLGDSDTLRPGDYAVAIGNPLGLERTITVGVISALNRYDLDNPIGARDMLYKDFIQTDAQINPGNSGGALADINGRVIGINNMYAADNAGIGFAIPINLAKKVMSQIISTGIVKRGFVGLSGIDISNEMQTTLQLSDSSGFQVDTVTGGFPADKAGIQLGDVIISLDGVRIRDYNDFRFKVAEHMPGDEITLQLMRDGELKTIQLILGDRDAYDLSLNALETNNWLGINVVDLSSQMAQDFQPEDFNNGVMIVGIDPGSPAARVGSHLAEGDVITEIDNRPIDNVADFLEMKQEYSSSRRSAPAILIYRQRISATGRITSMNVNVSTE